jgi:hypothetical protein
MDVGRQTYEMKGPISEGDVGTKAGIVDAGGAVLKAADVPRKNV